MPLFLQGQILSEFFPSLSNFPDILNYILVYYTMKTSLIIFIFLCSLSIKAFGNSINANLSIPTSPELLSHKKSKDFITKQVLIIFILVASLASLTVLFLLGCTVFWRRSRRRRGTIQSDEESNKERKNLHCCRFTIDEIRASTNNFDPDLKIGDGGFGRVYKGFIDGKQSPVAVKVLKSTSRQGYREFWTEVETLSRLRNPNLVSLIGYCNDQQFMIIVYDFMAHGTLRDHLYGTNNQPLAWKQRLEICIGAARGLVYLHAGAEHGIIIHRDVKTSNILLDENWVAKVSDFGLSRLGPESPSRSHVSTEVKGTFGYLDPEYFWTKQLTCQSDVYGFGVVMFEALCGRPAVDMGLEEEQQSLAQWAQYNVEIGTLNQIIDENLRGEIAPVCLELYGKVADWCLASDRKQRPKMADVLRALEFVLRLQEGADAAAEERIELCKAGKSEEKISSWGSGDQVLVRSEYKDDELKSCPTILWPKSNSQRILLRFFSSKGGLKWATQSTSQALSKSSMFHLFVSAKEPSW